jgi:hypothetical protein
MHAENRLSINDLEMYYEVHATGKAPVLLDRAIVDGRDQLRGRFSLRLSDRSSPASSRRTAIRSISTIR